MLEHVSREVVDFNVTRSPSDAWAAQQLREATPWGEGPRFLGSVRRECLDHIAILGENHLRRVLKEYVHAYFDLARPHQGLGQRIPRSVGRPPDEPTVGGDIVVTPILGGLHHDYRLGA